MNKAYKFFDILEQSNNICLISHVFPDGDSIGSLLMLNEHLKQYNKNVDIYIDGKIPYNYKYLLVEKNIKYTYENKKYDVVVVLDCGDEHRLGIFTKILDNTKKIICIDHHLTNTNFAHLNIIDSNISSTGELLYNIFSIENKKINKKMAEYLYISIVTDTGKFMYSNTTSKTHIIVSKLIDLGVNSAAINNKIFNSKPINVVKAFIEIISEIEFYYDNKLGITCINNEKLLKNKITLDDIDGIVEFIREIKEVEVSCVLKEIDKNEVKISLRSKNEIDVSKIAQRYGGGGHKKAAGFTINKNLYDSKTDIINTIKLYLGD